MSDPVSGEAYELDNHQSEMIDNLFGQYRQSEVIRGLSDVLGRQVQDLESAYWGLIGFRFLDYAQGAQLDQVGSLVGEDRRQAEEEEYRRAIASRILVNKSTSTVEEIILILQTLIGTEIVDVQQAYPAQLVIAYQVESAFTEAQRDRISEQTLQAIAAGVGLEMTEAEPGYFGFLEDDDALGFEEGILCESIYP